MNKERFETLIEEVTANISGRALDADLQAHLMSRYPPDGDEFKALAGACRTGIEEGWLCNREHGGIKFGRVIKPGTATQGFSVDVVDMDNIVGPHHGHPKGEIDMVIPESEGALFDGHGTGWVVYEPNSAHQPTVSQGRAIVLYLLPDGEIDFT